MAGIVQGVMLVLALMAYSVSAATLSGEEARHLLNRAGIGARPADIAAFSGLSRRDAVERLLAAGESGYGTPPPAELLEYQSPATLRALSADARKEDQRRRALALRTWWVALMLDATTPAQQLRERMTLFWHNHFVSSLQKVRSTKLMLEQNSLLRRHALGHFDDLLHAVGKDPAMLLYLDSATNRRGSPNENFAREVMELFTLGEGQFSEQDVKEAARAFTGWSIEPDTGAFRWRPFFHDGGGKTVLGVSGNLNGDEVLDILLAQPQTAEHLMRKLWREFISPSPDEKEVLRIASDFRDSDYDVRVALRGIFNSRGFWAPENRLALIKSPVDWVLGTLNSMEMDPPDSQRLSLVLRRLGQDLFAPPNVKGWPGGEAWINSGTLLARKAMAEHLLKRDGRMELRETVLDPSYQLK